MSPSGSIPATSIPATLRRGARLSPELTAGAGRTLGLALVSTAGRVVVPVSVQQTIDRGILGPDGPRPGLVLAVVLAALGGLAVTGLASYRANLRIFRATEAGLATLRTKAFRHVHDLSVLTQGTQLRGSLVSRVTSDVDTISTFVQWGGLMLVLASGQLLVATVLMALYSWPLALLVWACYLPLFVAIRPLQRVVSRSYVAVRERVGDLLGGGLGVRRRRRHDPRVCGRGAHPAPDRRRGRGAPPGRHPGPAAGRRVVLRRRAAVRAGRRRGGRGRHLDGNRR